MTAKAPQSHAQPPQSAAEVEVGKNYTAVIRGRQIGENANREDHP